MLTPSPTVIGSMSPRKTEPYQTLEREGTVYVKRGLGTFIAAVPRERDAKGRHAAVARQIAERMLREGYRQGILASDLLEALQELAPKREG